jgi:hypothetical protein
VPANLSLTIGAGTIVKLNPLVNITNSGSMLINGTPDRPVVFTATMAVFFAGFVSEVKVESWRPAAAVDALASASETAIAIARIRSLLVI